MSQKLLSVIVAVYNVENYIAECITSICNQTYFQMEIILVDDGSTDNSGAICDSFAEKDPRIIVIHQKNKGLSGARNTALDVMHGEYMTIVDGDDYVLPEAFAAAISAIEKHHLDRCSFGAFREGNGGNGTGKLSLNLEEEHDARLQDCIINERTINWGSVYKSSLWKGIRYPVGHVHEDSAVAHYIIDRIQRCGSIDKEYYYYRITPTGICQTAAVKPNTRYDYVLACKDRLQYAIKKNMCVPQSRAVLIKAILSYLTAFYGTDSPVDSNYNNAIQLLREQRNLPYDDSLLNSKYKIFLFCFDRANFVHKMGAKLSIWAKSIHRK